MLLGLWFYCIAANVCFQSITFGDLFGNRNDGNGRVVTIVLFQRPILFARYCMIANMFDWNNPTISLLTLRYLIFRSTRACIKCALREEDLVLVTFSVLRRTYFINSLVLCLIVWHLYIGCILLSDQILLAYWIDSFATANHNHL